MSVRHASRSVVDVLAPCKPSNYVCRQCRRNRQLPAVLTQQRGYASEGPDGLPFAERVRRKLWQGKPPGPENVEDVYGGPGAIERALRERQRRRLQQRPEPQAESLRTETDGTSSNESSALARQAEQETSFQSIVPESTSEEAQQPAEEPAQQSEYKSATSWDGLYYIGHKGHWKEMPVKQQDEYSRWLESPIRPAWTYQDLISLMHQSIIECQACNQSGLNPRDASKLDVSSPFSHDQLEVAAINISDDGEVIEVESLEVLSAQTISSFFRQVEPASQPQKMLSLAEQAAIIARTQPEMKPLEPRLLYTPKDVSFLDARLDITTPTTFAILKRFSILTNHNVPDPLINDLASEDPTKNTIGALLVSMAEHIKPKPANLAEQLLKNPSLASQGNLLVLGRRETPVDKEKELGRWKIIEQELKARGLPVLGTSVRAN